MSETERDATKEFAQYLQTKDHDYIENEINGKLRNVLIELGILSISEGVRVVNDDYIVE